MAESSNYRRSVLGGSDEDYSRSVLGGSDEDYRRSVLGGSDMIYSRTIFSGSDEVEENPCEPCQNDGKNTTAVKYCTDCSEYMCGPCSKNHTKYKAFRHHVIKDMDAIKHVYNEDCTKIIDESTHKLTELDVSSAQVLHRSRPGHMIPSSGAIRNVTVKLVSTINTSTKNDNKSPFIYDLTVVQTHYCVVTYMKNTSVKVVDTRTRCVTSQIQLRDADFVGSITSVNDDQVAVSANINGVSNILLFSVSASGIISDTHTSIDVEYPNNGITHSNDWFYAAVSSRIDVISMQGQITTTFTNKSFSGLRGIALSNDHNTLYVCSRVNDTVFSVDLKCNVTSSYKDNSLMYPEGITVDNEGYVYVCSEGTRCIHQLAADLSKGQVVIEDVDVWRCTFNKNNNSLYLVEGKEIKIYNLTYH